jgi:REP element-mobilizing transposase RayT
MPYRKTDFTPGHYYHLYNRGNNRQNIFFERENYLFFLRQFRHYLIGQTLQVIAYCLMPNHYHFLVYLQADNLSQKMQAFTLSYTKAINRRYQRSGSLFQGRFQTIPVNDENYLLYLSRYIHLNPVKAGLVRSPQEWEFSSYLEYANLRRGTLPRLEPIREQLGVGEVYRSFMEAAIDPQPNLQHLMFDE